VLRDGSACDYHVGRTTGLFRIVFSSFGGLRSSERESRPVRRWRIDHLATAHAIDTADGPVVSMSTRVVENVERTKRLPDVWIEYALPDIIPNSKLHFGL
jgi:hypothetical protein